jgi:hypothetical protein
LGIGPNPQSPIPNPQSPIPMNTDKILKLIFLINLNKFEKMINKTFFLNNKKTKYGK